MLLFAAGRKKQKQTQKKMFAHILEICVIPVHTYLYNKSLTVITNQHTLEPTYTKKPI